MCVALKRWEEGRGRESSKSIHPDSWMSVYATSCFSLPCHTFHHDCLCPCELWAKTIFPYSSSLGCHFYPGVGNLILLPHQIRQAKVWHDQHSPNTTTAHSPVWGLAGSVARMYLGVSSSSRRWVTSPVQLCNRMGWGSFSIPSKRLAILSFLNNRPEERHSECGKWG